MAQKKDDSKLLIYLSDLFTLICTLIFAAYLSTTINSDRGTNWLHNILLGVTLLFCILFIIKILIINRFIQSSETSKKLKRVYKYIKYTLKLLMLAIIILGLIRVLGHGQENLAVIISTVTSNLFFLILLIFDTVMLRRAKRKRLEESKK